MLVSFESRLEIREGGVSCPDRNREIEGREQGRALKVMNNKYLLF